MQRIAFALVLALQLGLLAAPFPAGAEERALVVPASGVIGVDEALLRADYWIRRIPDAHAVLMSPSRIAAQNARLFAEDPSMNALERLPGSIARAEVAARIGKLSIAPSRALYFADGRPVEAEWLASLEAAANLDAIPESQATRFGLVLRRAALRTFPDATRVFADSHDHDIDRFQESALFVGTPVAILHSSADARWLFVVAPNYSAWIEAEAVAIDERATVLGYASRRPARFVLGARADTVFTPENPAVSELRLEMGQSLPLVEMRAGAQVNGQNPAFGWPLLVPVRNEGGDLAFTIALLPKSADSGPAPLPFTRANLVRQAFKFLGERYGWGHDYQGRDCSGFVAEVYRSHGLELPRNTGDQSRSPVLSNRRDFGAGDDRATRERALAEVEAGDLIFIPGHLMMVLGHVDGVLYVIHDIQGGSWIDEDGQLHKMHLNGVSVTPFAPLRFDEAGDFTDRMTAILRIP